MGRTNRRPANPEGEACENIGKGTMANSGADAAPHSSAERPAHSPLGASSAERWMECPGSVGLIQQLSLPTESDAPDYRREGTAAHAALEHCLRENKEAWEVVGHDFGGCTVSVEMADAISTFLTIVSHRSAASQIWIERSIDLPSFHPQFYGTVDLGLLLPGVLEINDFKYGLGVVVEVWHNPQIMYYAYGLLMQLEPSQRPKKVRLRIIQPRAFHPDGPVREWEVDADVITAWAEGTLKPAMLRTATDKTLSPGDHCRFCPAKLACPVMVALFEAAISADPERVVDLSDPALDVQYPMIDAVKHYIRAVEQETYNRAIHGREFAHSKLVYKKANRVFKPDAERALKEQLGDAIYSEPQLLSPAQIEALGGVAKKLVTQYAYTPESGLTIAATRDKRVAVKVPSSAETFKVFLERAEKSE